ncbi:FHA domain-containing serine/threonine-protein kinase [Brotaphodocola sp.]|uniref:FHA domain-containing serine/threonine-protein kinase n=1 Tax=Brotaphodocola sp. TaxID=3073577 RepID=UPI003D7D1013
MTQEIKKICPNCFSSHYDPEQGCQDCGYLENLEKRGTYVLPVYTILADRYLIGRVLGIGGFGITYKAFDRKTREICAVKELAPFGLVFRNPGECQMQLSHANFTAQFDHIQMRFIEEAQMLKKFETISGIVQVRDCFKANQTAYFSMEFLDGMNLRKIVQVTKARLSVESVNHIVREVGEAMELIHRKTGILHRDISPENIYILKNGTVKLLDFGSARQQSMDENKEFTVQYKHGFAPPEQYSRTGHQGTYTDVYALASTYYYTLTGIPIPDAMDRLEGGNYLPLSSLRTDVSKSVSEAVDRALILDYRERTQTMAQFLEELSNSDSGVAVEKTGVPYLELISGAHAGMRWKLPMDQEIKIGRSPKWSNIIVSEDECISKQQCCLTYDSKKREFLLRDVSSNGTFVQGERLEKEREYRYSENVQISFAGSDCVLRAGISYE